MGEELREEMVDTSGHSRRAAHWGEGGIAKRRLELQTTLASPPISGVCEETTDISDHFSNNFKNAMSVRCLSYLNQ